MDSRVVEDLLDRDGPGDEVESPILTVLVADVGNASELWERWPDTMSLVVPDLYEVFDKVLKREHGRRISRVGDGIVAVFDEADEAVRAAIAIEREVGARAWVDLGTLGAAIGLDTGPCQRRGREYFGATVHRAARVQRLAHDGQILATDTTVQLTNRSNMPELETAPAGSLCSVGSGEPIGVCTIRVPGLPSTFPPLGGLAAAADVPREASSLIGRDGLVDEVIAAVRDHRLVTVCGTGGVGKSRVAVRVASLVRRPFDDGVRFIDLSVAQTRRVVTDVVASSLRVLPTVGESALVAVVRSLRPARALVVLDGCEHVLDEVRDLVRVVLADCPWVHVLVTSRERVNLTDEHLVDVPALLADDVALPTPAHLSPAVELFFDRARAVDRDYPATSEALSMAAQLCRRLGGVPLAIELAASRLAIEPLRELVSHSATDLLAHLGDTDGSGKRLGSVAGSVAWSYELLTSSERSLLVALSAFAGTFTREMGLALLRDKTRARFDAAFDRLVSCALISRDASEPHRYRLLETTRMFAASRAGSARERQLRRAHAGLMLRRAEQLGPLIRTEDELDAARVLRGDFDDYRAAMDWMLDEEDVESASRLLVAIFQFCHFQLLAEANEWATRLAELVDDSSQLAADVCGAAALAAWFRGDSEQAIVLGRRALSTGSPTENATMWSCLALLDSFVYSGRLAEAAEYFRMLVDASRASPSLFWRINGCGYEAISYLMFGRVERASDRANTALSMARELGNSDCLHWALHCLGRVVAADDPVLGATVFEEAMQAARRADSRWSLSLDLIEWIPAKRVVGETTAAAVGLLELLELLTQAGNRSQLSQALAESARVLASVGELEIATVLMLSREGLPAMPVSPQHADDDARFCGELLTALGEAGARVHLRARSTQEHDIVVQCRDALERLVRESDRAAGREPLSHWRDVVVLYTDLVSSTALNVAVGDERFLELLREHDRIVRRRLADFGGAEFTYTGDGFGASFSSIEGALRFAVGLQDDIDDANRRHPHDVLRVRVGLARGDVVVDEGNLFGQTVVRAVRICAAADAGQVLVEEQIADSVGPSIIRCVPVGSFPLKGFGTCVPLYEARRPEVPQKPT